MTTERVPIGSRAIARDAVRTSIAAAAVELFAERGFDAVTVEQVAEAVGMSTRSVHRHFPAKEDLVVGDHSHWGDALADAVAARPTGEPVWESLRHGFHVLLHPPFGRPTVRGQHTLQVISGTPSLRARFTEKHRGFARLLVPVVAARLPAGADPLTAATLVDAAIACFEAALMAWAVADDPESVPALLDRTFGVLAPAP